MSGTTARSILARTVGALVLVLCADGARAAQETVVRRLVFGSYAEPAHAEAEAEAVAEALGIEIEQVVLEVEGRRMIRVVSPLIEGEAIWPLTALAAKARIDAWVWRVDAEDAGS